MLLKIFSSPNSSVIFKFNIWTKITLFNTIGCDLGGGKAAWQAQVCSPGEQQVEQYQQFVLTARKGDLTLGSAEQIEGRNPLPLFVTGALCPVCGLWYQGDTELPERAQK